MYHFKSEVFLNNHACCGAFQSKDALSVAMRSADTILATRDFSLSGCIANMSTLFSTPDSSPPATFECNLQVGWAQVRKAMHPIFSIRVQQFIAHCWQEVMYPAMPRFLQRQLLYASPMNMWQEEFD